MTPAEPHVTFAAVVPATDDPPTLERCLAALRAADEAPEEIVVVDDLPTHGPAAARNDGATRTRADVLVFVDADIEVHRDAFVRLRRAFADGELTAVFGSYDDAFGGDGLVSAFRNLLHHHVHHESPGPARTFWAGLGAVRRDAFEAAGGFDATRYTRPSVEDIELGQRLAAAGARMVLDPRIQGTHLKRWTLRTMLETDLLRRGIPWAELLLRPGADRSALNLGTRHRLSALAVGFGALAAARGRGRGALAGLTALLVLNRDFYALLLRRRGAAEAAAGVGLHALHHLTGIAALPAAAALRLRRTLRAQGVPRPNGES